MVSADSRCTQVNPVQWLQKLKTNVCLLPQLLFFPSFVSPEIPSLTLPLEVGVQREHSSHLLPEWSQSYRRLPPGRHLPPLYLLWRTERSISSPAQHQIGTLTYFPTASVQSATVSSRTKMTPVKDAGSRQVNRKKCHFWSSNHPLAAGKEVKIGKNKGEIEAFGGEKGVFNMRALLSVQRRLNGRWESFGFLRFRHRGKAGWGVSKMEIERDSRCCEALPSHCLSSLCLIGLPPPSPYSLPTPHLPSSSSLHHSPSPLPAVRRAAGCQPRRLLVLPLLLLLTMQLSSASRRIGRDEDA